MKIIDTKAGIIKAIESIQTRGKKLDADIHRAGVSCLDHLNKHHCVELVNQLIHAMPKGSRINALRSWFEEFGTKLKFDEEKNEFVAVQPEPLTYPYIGRSEPRGIVVLFTSPEAGVSLVGFDGACIPYPVGQYRTDWCESNFQLVDDVFTLQMK